MTTPTSKREDPRTKFRFNVEIDGLAVAHFQGVGGLNAEREVLAQQEGGRNDHLVKLPGQGSLGAVTLKRGWSGDRAFFDWMKEARELGVSGKSVRRTVDVVLLADDAVTETGRYTLFGAWPAKWTAEDFTGESGQAIESLELAHEGIRHSGGGGVGAGGPSMASGGGAPGLADRLRAAAGAARSRGGAAAAAQAARDAAAGLAGEGRGLLDQARGAASEARSAVQQARDAARENPAEAAWRSLGAARGAAEGAAAAPARAARAAMEQGRAMARSASSAPSRAAHSAASDAAPGGAGGAPSPAAAASAARARGAGFARQGGPQDEAPSAAGAWSDGVAATQAPTGFGEPPLQPGDRLGV